MTTTSVPSDISPALTHDPPIDTRPPSDAAIASAKADLAIATAARVETVLDEKLFGQIELLELWAADFAQEKAQPDSTMPGDVARFLADAERQAADPAPWQAVLDGSVPVGWAVERLRRLEAEVDRQKRMAAAAIRLAERREAAAMAALWPAIASWAMANKPTKGKTIKLPGTEAYLQWRKSAATVVIENPQRCQAALEADEAIGYETMIDLGIIKVETRLSLSTAKTFILDHGLVDVDGVKSYPAAENLKMITPSDAK